MDEHIPLATIPSNEAVAFCGVEPFHGAGLFDCHLRRSFRRCGRSESQSAFCGRGSGARIHAQYLCDVCSFVARTNTNFEGVTRLYDPEPVLSQHGSMKERIAGPIEEFDEAKALLGTEPFDHPLDRGARGCFEPGLAEPGSGAEGTRLWVVGIHVELATLRVVEISMSHWVPNRVGWIGLGERCQSSAVSDAGLDFVDFFSSRTTGRSVTIGMAEDDAWIKPQRLLTCSRSRPAFNQTAVESAERKPL